MVNLERFGKQQVLVEQLMRDMEHQLTELLGEEARLELVSEPNAALFERMLAIEEEVFKIEDNVYTEADIRECLEEEDSLLLVLRINGQVEGYVFGYDDEPSAPVVEGTDYFMDSGVISLAYQAKGLGSRIGLLVLFLIYLLEYHSLGITTERRDKSGRELVKFYRRLGFEEARTVRPENVGMRIELDTQTIRNLVRKLPVAGELSALLAG